jgi:hypothetical protein
MPGTNPIVLILALASLFFAILMPPEAYPAGKMAVVLSSTFALLAAIRERRLPRLYLAGGLGVFLVLLVHSLWFSVDAYRSIEFLTVLWTYYCLLGFFAYAASDVSSYVAASGVALSVIVSGYGLYQFFWGLDETLAAVLDSAAAQDLKAPALAILGTRRVYSTLALPGTLWGFLLTALPLHAILWNRNRALNAMLVFSGMLLLITGSLTRSVGFFAGLYVLAMAWALINPGWNPRKKALAAVALSVLAGGALYFASLGMIEGRNSVALRFRNSVSAWNIFAVHPAGTGLNTFGIVYPQYQLPGANETQYAHNTLLQIMSEVGYGSIFALMAGVLLLVQTKRTWTIDRRMYCLLLALIVWLFHNFIDINFYFPSLGVMGAILAGVCLFYPRTEFVAPPKSLSAAVPILGVFCVAFSVLAFVSGELQHRAQVEYETGKSIAAIETLRIAQAVAPWNSALFLESGRIELDVYTKTRNEKFLDAATRSYRRGAGLSPLKFDAHLGLALCLSAAHRVDDALAEIQIAGKLYPANDYVRSIATLIERQVR